MDIDETRLPARFWAKVDKNGPIPEHRPELGPCWIWTGGTADGYGRWRADRRTLKTHRTTYETFVGPVPAERELDHLCRSRACCKPTHLEAVTHATNVRRGARPAQVTEASIRRQRGKTHCAKGHPYDTSNTILRKKRGVDGKPVRGCRTCKNAQMRRAYQDGKSYAK